MEIYLNQKLAVLEHVYDIYARVSAGFQIACRKHCAHCCTCHVTLTTLEGYRIIRSASRLQRDDMAHWLQSEPCRKRYRPELTINQIAQRCISGKDIPDEKISNAWNTCPLLNQDVCPIYLDRPFGCRCMVSRVKCSPDGYADMDPFVLTVNNVFLQVIEHIDSDGCFGNLTDVLQCLLVDANRRAYRDRILRCQSHHLVLNQPMKVLMIPPEHQRRIQPILASLRSIAV